MTPINFGIGIDYSELFSNVQYGHQNVYGNLGAPTITTIVGEGMLVAGDPQEYAAVGLAIISGPTVLFTPSDYLLQAFTSEFVLPGDKTTINSIEFTVSKILKVVAPDGYVIMARIALEA